MLSCFICCSAYRAVRWIIDQIAFACFHFFLPFTNKGVFFCFKFKIEMVSTCCIDKASITSFFSLTIDLTVQRLIQSYRLHRKLTHYSIIFDSTLYFHYSNWNQIWKIWWNKLWWYKNNQILILKSSFQKKNVLNKRTEL